MNGKIKFAQELERKYGAMQVAMAKAVVMQVGTNYLLKPDAAKTLVDEYSESITEGMTPIISVSVYSQAVTAAVEMAEWAEEYGIANLQDIMPNEFLTHAFEEEED